MAIRIGVAKERREGERRVALDPATATRFVKLGVEVALERGAGEAAHFPDGAYSDVEFREDGASLCSDSDVVLRVSPPTVEEAGFLKEGSVLVGVLQPHLNLDLVKVLVERGITSFAMELVPRISRAQSMDVLSSQAAVAGYKVALMAADLASQFFPMLTTAAGTIRPAKVVVVGAGVAGLQAIATAKRLGAMVEAYDIRPAAREQVESLGAKMIDTGVSAEGEGGYARELTDEEKAKQAEVLARHVAAANAVITTASIPGRAAPRIITREMVEAMKPGSVVVDLAAESGGNCELTEAGRTVDHGGVLVAGPTNIASSIPIHATEMYAKNLLNFLSPQLKEGALELDWEDEVLIGSVLTHAGEVRHEPTRAQLDSA